MAISRALTVPLLLVADGKAAVRDASGWKCPLGSIQGLGPGVDVDVIRAGGIFAQFCVLFSGLLPPWSLILTPPLPSVLVFRVLVALG